MKEIEQKVDEVSRVFEEFKKANDKEILEIKKFGAASTAASEKVASLNEVIEKLQGEIKQVQTAMNRKAEGAQDNTETKSAVSKAIEGYLRKGGDPTSVAEYKTFMSVDSDADGGFLVSPEMSSEVVKKVFESSPMRALASVQSISTDALDILEDLDEAGSGWVGEIETRSDTNSPQLKLLKIPVHEIYAQPKATQRLLDDASINIESWLAGKVSEKFARDEATAFISGNGVNKPMGILSYANGTSFGQIEQVESASSGVIAADDMIEIFYAIKDAYLNNASWLMKRNTQKVLRKFKGSDGQYLWAPGLNGAQNNTLLGKPIYEANDMGAYTNSALAVAFGDFKQGYQIVDRIGIRVLRDMYTAKPYVKFYTTKRVGGGVKNFEAIKILKIKA